MLRSEGFVYEICVGIGRTLVTKVIERMIRKGCTEILLETEVRPYITISRLPLVARQHLIRAILTCLSLTNLTFLHGRCPILVHWVCTPSWAS